MKKTEKSIFDEQYRVISVERDRLVIRGILSGKILSITNPQFGTPLNEQNFPPGKLIALTDPSNDPHN